MAGLEGWACMKDTSVDAPTHSHALGPSARCRQSSGKAKAHDSGGQQETGWGLQVTQVQVG